MKNIPKSIVIIFNSLNIGGIETKIIDLCRYFSSKSNIKIYLVLKEKTGSLLKFIPGKVQILSLKIPSLFKLKTAFFPLWTTNQIHKIKPNLIIAFGNYCGIAASLAKTFGYTQSHLIISEDSSIDIQLNSDTFSQLRTQFVKMCYPKADKIITLTTAGKIKILKLLKTIDKSKITIAPNWLPNSYITNTSQKTTQKNIDLLFLGRFEPQKNPLEFLEISQKLIQINPKIKIIMVGYGSLETTIKKYINSNGLSKNISILPATTDPLRYYLDSKIFLLTSVHEGFPLTLLEASATGCLPLCRLLPETKHFFDYYPDLCQYQNLNSAVKNITYLLSNSDLRKNISRHYQQQVRANQISNFTTTINLIKQYL
jgi:glycosyltransferase involved in cell wall biosynthesis